ncbi:TPA: cobalt ABC transporter permease [Salmonella enterica subsp. enterica serovar Welikade]|nr:cobalt ABC transporter permease [Salmonella enterica subsp. enterica serovar Welikade]
MHSENTHDGVVVSPEGSQPAISMFHLESFEWRVHTEETEQACRELVFLLGELDRAYGKWSEHILAWAPGQRPETLNRHLCTRIAGAVTTLFSRPGFSVSDEGYTRLMNLHRWLALIFAVSSYRHGDHIIRNLNAAGGGKVDPLTLNTGNLKLFCLCYYPDSEIALQPDVLWQFDRETVVRLFCALISGRALPTVQAHAKREQLLAWLPQKLTELDSLDFLPVAVLHDVYMHCSYADLAGKHDIKRSLNALVRRTLLRQGFYDLAPRSESGESVGETSAPERRQGKKQKKRGAGCDVSEDSGKPVMLVVVEHFTSQHSVWRTHSVALRALRSRFSLHGIALAGSVDEVSEKLFDVCYRLPGEEALKEAWLLARHLKPSVVYYAGIGMFPFTIYLSNLRLAPLQLVGLGHGASTFCEYLDGFVVEEDFVGDPACFSEPVLRVPSNGMPFVPPAQTVRVVAERSPFEERRQARAPFSLPVRVAVCASIMKINPGFLATLAEIQARSRVPVQFCFYIGFAQGLTLNYLQEAILSVLPEAEVNAHMAVQDYQKALNSCELFANPFPYGNMNGVVDVVRQGLPGVCLSGPEIHAHIDEGLFRRLGLPEALIARDREGYVRAVLRLAEDTAWREKLQKQLRENDPEQVLFQGYPEKFVDVVWRARKEMTGGCV